MSYLIKPAGYKALLNLSQTEMGIKKIKDFFQQNLSSELRLRRVTAPLFVLKGMGINDDLNGTERAVTFPIKDLDDAKAEIVHSLAKWKRLTLADYQIEKGYGIYTDMNAIRSDEELGNLHSLYVDQWDWERVMGAEERNVDFLGSMERQEIPSGCHVVQCQLSGCEHHTGWFELQPSRRTDSGTVLPIYPSGIPRIQSHPIQFHGNHQVHPQRNSQDGSVRKLQR